MLFLGCVILRPSLGAMGLAFLYFIIRLLVSTSQTDLWGSIHSHNVLTYDGNAKHYTNICLKIFMIKTKECQPQTERQV